MRLLLCCELLLFGWYATVSQAAPEFDVPSAELRVLSPNGFEVSIPAVEGITLFAFHGKRNAEFDGREAGDWARDIIRERNGRYTFRDCDTMLRIGDVINFWTYVIWNGLGYHQDDGQFVVSDIGNGSEVASASCSQSHATYQVPPASLRLLQPRGFEVSIPADEGISLFAFHGQLNAEFEGGREAGTWSEDILRVRDGRFTFRDQQTLLQSGDVLYFWTFVVWHGLGYHQEGSFVINETAGQQTTHITTTNIPNTTTTSATPTTRLDHVTCTESATRFNDQLEPPCAGELLFEDNFDGFDANKWRVEQRFSGQPDHEFGVYLNRADTVEVIDGTLSLAVVRLGDDFRTDNLQFGTNCTGNKSTDECSIPTNFTPPIGLGQISTANTFRFLYGRVEIRARLPYADWVFPQLFLQPANNDYGAAAYASGQMRIAFATPAEPLTGGVLLGADRPFRALDMCRVGGRRAEGPTNETQTRAANEEHWRNAYHVFSLEWRPDSITVAIDNRTFCQLTPPFAKRRVNGREPPAAADWRQHGSTPMAPFDRPFYVTLGIGVGGRRDFPERPDVWPKPWRNDEDVASGAMAFWAAMRDRGNAWPGTEDQLLVDYVRVYAL